MVVVLTKCIIERTLAHLHGSSQQSKPLVTPFLLKRTPPPPALAKIIFVSNLVKVAVNIQKIYFKIILYILVQSLFNLKSPHNKYIGKVTHMYMCCFKTDRFHNAETDF
jgi:hypothetical protein